MSVDLCIELDQINWLEARKSLLVFDLKTGEARPISTDAIGLLFRIAWRQGEGYDGRTYLSEKQWQRSTGLSRSSFYRFRSELEQTELVKRLVRGSNINGTRANLQVNLSKIRTLPKSNVPSAIVISPSSQFSTQTPSPHTSYKISGASTSISPMIEPS